jgi:hypothetical protein
MQISTYVLEENIVSKFRVEVTINSEGDDPTEMQATDCQTTPRTGIFRATVLRHL